MSLDNEQSKVIQGRFHLTRKLGAGSFGEIFEAKDLKTGKLYACKAESLRTKHPQLRLEYQIYRSLSNSKYFVRVWGYVTHYNHQIMIMDKLGDSLEQLFTSCGRKFSIGCVCHIAIQILSRIEELHKHNYLHRDIKPDNFLIGHTPNGDLTSKEAGKIYMIDLGLGKVWKEGGRHIPEKHGKRLIGTPRYASINTHFGHEQSRRDDLESLGYMLMYFAHGQLPWQGLRGQTKEEKYQKIGHKKRDTRLQELCNGYPDEFRRYLKATQNLGFQEDPPYDQYRSWFRNVLNREQRTSHFDFDWQTKYYAKQQQKASSRSNNNNTNHNSNNNNNNNTSNKRRTRQQPAQRTNVRRSSNQNNNNNNNRNAQQQQQNVNPVTTTPIIPQQIATTGYPPNTNTNNNNARYNNNNNNNNNNNIHHRRTTNQQQQQTPAVITSHSRQIPTTNYASNNHNNNPLTLPNLQTQGNHNGTTSKLIPIGISPNVPTPNHMQTYIDRYQRCRTFQNNKVSMNPLTRNTSATNSNSPILQIPNNTTSNNHNGTTSNAVQIAAAHQQLGNMLFTNANNNNSSRYATNNNYNNHGTLMNDYGDLMANYKKLEQLRQQDQQLIQQYKQRLQQQQTQIDQQARTIETWKHKYNSLKQKTQQCQHNVHHLQQQNRMLQSQIEQQLYAGNVMQQPAQKRRKISSSISRRSSNNRNIEY